MNKIKTLVIIFLCSTSLHNNYNTVIGICHKDATVILKFDFNVVQWIIIQMLVSTCKVGSSVIVQYTRFQVRTEAGSLIPENIC